jgi:hypothetical protein
LAGNETAMVDLFSQFLGLHPKVCRALVAMIRGKRPQILESIGDMAKELDTDPDIAMIIGEIALDNYNPDKEGVNTPKGTVVLAIKKLLRKAFPQFPVETVDGILQIVSEGDPRPLVSLMEVLKIKPCLFAIGQHYIT